MKQVVSVNRADGVEGICPQCNLKHTLYPVFFNDGTTGELCGGCANAHSAVST